MLSRNAPLAGKKGHDSINGIQIVWNQFIVFHFDVIGLFQMRDEFKHAGRVNDARLQKGRAIVPFLVLTKEEVLNDEMSYLLPDAAHRFIHFR
jgi:hypothetical protein